VLNPLVDVFQPGHVHEVEVCVFVELFTELLDDNGFIFLSHDFLLKN